jgi:lipoate-protein ligase A
LVPDQEVQVQGICDLTIDNRKCSGNSLRVARDHVLYHGTLLVDFDLPLLERCLRTPPRQPAYRAERAHGSFVANLPWSRETQDETTLWHDWCQELQRQWQTGAGTSAHVLCAEGREEVRQLAREKYENPQWIWAR